MKFVNQIIIVKFLEEQIKASYRAYNFQISRGEKSSARKEVYFMNLYNHHDTYIKIKEKQKITELRIQFKKLPMKNTT